MSNWLTLAVGAAIVVILAALGAYVWLRGDDIAQTFEQRVSHALQWWGQADSKLRKLRASTLLWLVREMDDLLQYSDELFEETYLRLLNLRSRAKTIKMLRSGPQGFFR